jgi:hypothetical protein
MPATRPTAAAGLAAGAFLALFFGALFVLMPSARVAADAGHTGEARPAPPVPLLWRVSDGDNSLYLLGAFHLLHAGDYPLAAETEAAFADAESLLLELSPEDMTSPQLPLAMLRAAVRTDGTPLLADLDPARAARLEDWQARNATALADLGFDALSMQGYEAWYAATIAGAVALRRQGLDPALGLDMHFAERAFAAGKPAAGLETMQDHVALLDGMALEEQLQFLDDALAEDTHGEARALYRAWRRGDAETLRVSTAERMRREHPALYRRIQLERNLAWLPQLEARLAQLAGQDTLVVVGALHLLGEDGVVEHLRAKGYAVERLGADLNRQLSSSAPAKADMH